MGGAQFHLKGMSLDEVMKQNTRLVGMFEWMCLSVDLFDVTIRLNAYGGEHAADDGQPLQFTPFIKRVGQAE